MTLRTGLTSLLVIVAACGGGTGRGGDITLETAALEGYVYEVDGQTEVRSGVEVRIPETGQAVLTDADGGFAFEDIPAAGVTLTFGPALSAVAHREGDRQQDQDRDQDRDGEQETDGEKDRTQERTCEQDCEPGEGAQTASTQSHEGRDDDEDEHGNPHLHGLEVGDRIRVRCALEDGEVREFCMAGVDRLRAMSRLTRDVDSPDADVCGKVKIESRDDREKFEVEAEKLDAGDAVAIYMAAPPAEGEDPAFSLIGTATADDDGEAELERDTNDGDALPFDVDGVADLEGYRIEVRLDTETEPLLLTGEVPALPESWPAPGDGMEEGVRARARARLFADAGEGEAHVEMRRRERNRQSFEVEVEELRAGLTVEIRMEASAGSGSFARLGTCATHESGECEFKMEGALPFGASDVSELVGRQVRVRQLEQNGTGPLLFSGTIPPLVAD
jgi:hypothetical protein